MQVDFLGRVIGAFDPVLGATGHVVPGGDAALVAGLAGAELFQVVRRGHAADVEEVFVLTNPARTRVVAFAFGGDAVDGDFRAVDRDRPGDADLRAELVHQVHVRVQAQVARVLDHPVGASLAEVLGELVATFVQRTVLGVGPAGPEQHVALVEGIETTALLGPAAGAHGRVGRRRLRAACAGSGWRRSSSARS